MPVSTLTALPISREEDAFGAILGGGLLYTFQAGSSIPAPTFQDINCLVANTNPVVLDATGRAVIRYLPQAYKLKLTDKAGTVLWTVDNYWPPFTAEPVSAYAFITALLGPQTPAERAANVTPVNPVYAPGHVDRYGTNLQPGVTSMTAAFQAAINQARNGGVDIVWGETAPYLIDAPLDCTNAVNGLTFRQLYPQSTNPSPPGSVLEGAIVVKHPGYTVFDLSGTQMPTFHDMSLVTSNTIYPKTCFFLARATASNGAFARILNTNIQGYFSVAILYNYASETGIYADNNWSNAASDTGACNVVVTSSNYFKGGANFLASSFATIPLVPPSSAQSCLSHEFRGGTYTMLNASATSDLFYLEGGVDKCRLLEFWCALSNANATTHGRAFVYNETVNGGANRIDIHGVKLENSVTQPAYGIQVGPGTGAVNFWSIVDSFFNTFTHDIQIDASVLAPGWRVLNLSNLSGAAGMNAPGTVTDGWFDWAVAINIGTSTRNVFRNSLSNLTRTSHSADTVFDHSGVLLLDSSLAMNGAGAPGQFNGWGTPVGGSVISNYNITDAGGASSNTNKAVAEIIVALKAMGLFGA